ncbi:ATP-binding protein [Mucilaginibacter sp.]|uniref:ATP-binding protein n=1 Tax=Mucilaginibacter sp. TaxID=1882438 RepID=UPI003D0E47A7
MGVLYLLLHYKKAQKLQSNIENLITARENSALIDSCIIDLYSADNNSRLYTTTGNKAYLKKFSKDIVRITGIVDQINFNSKNIADKDTLKFKKLIDQKTQKTSSYIKLRILTDSLIKYSIKINRSLKSFNQQTSKPVVKVEHVVTIDTLKNNIAKPRKKLLGRIVEAFSKKGVEANSQPVVIKKDTVITSVLTSKDTVYNNKHEYKTYYKKLNVVNNKLISNERQILFINDNLLKEIIISLKHYKTVEQLYIDDSRNGLKESMTDVFVEFKQLSAISALFLLTLLVLVFYNIWKIFRNDQEIIEHSEKTEQYANSKSMFLAGMSHEIRTPLNSVIGFSEQLSHSNLSEQQKEQVDAIRSSSEMLLELVNEILDFSKYETGKMNFESSSFMLNQAIEEIFNGMNIQAIKKHILLENQIAIDRNICCQGDKMRLKQVIMNLIGNAIKFTVKGKVTLIAYVDERDDQSVLKVTVKDTGLGIHKNDLPHIFEEFSQVANAQKSTRHKGTGLGLAICKKIIELQGGRISVKSEPGQGSEFSFELPFNTCANKDVAITQTMSDELMAEMVDEKYILFTEDNQLNVLLGTTILKKWKIKYDVAYNGKEAFELFKKNNYDIILTDIQMPEMNGLELTQQIRNYPDQTKATVTIMALTANVMKEDRDVYFKSGINDVILKPFLEKNLVEKIALAVQDMDNATRFV